MSYKRHAFFVFEYIVMDGHNTARVHVSAFLTCVRVYFHACVCVWLGKVHSCGVLWCAKLKCHSAVSKVCLFFSISLKHQRLWYILDTSVGIQTSKYIDSL